MFIESVRARATCNTIISSHPVSSHRPCTNSSLLSRVSSPFPSWFFFYSSLSTRSLSPPPPSLFTFTFLFTVIQFCLFSPRHFDFFVLQSRIRISDSSSCLYIPFISFPSVSPSLLFFPSTVLILLPSRVYSYFFPYNPHRVSTILSPVVFTTSIQSYLIWRRLAETVTQPSPIFSLRPVQRELHSFLASREKKSRPESITSVISTWRCSPIFLFLPFFLLVVHVLVWSTFIL